MIKSMFSGITGIRGHQTMMDVIANNIANVNTVGFKNSRVIFTDVFYQTLNSAAAPNSTDGSTGGTNPSQVGYGAQVSTIDVLNTQGGFMQTDRSEDLYISGEGYFIVGNDANNVYYTRVGNFNFDSMGYLVDAQGNHVRGASIKYTIDSSTGVLTPESESGAENLDSDSIYGEPLALANLRNIQIDRNNYSNVTIGPDGKITGINNTTGQITTLAQIALATFANANGLSQQGNLYMSSTSNSGNAVINAPNSIAAGALKTCGLEMSNVDLSKQFTDMIMAQRGLQANSRVITTSDEILQELVGLKR
ncbi:MAG: flagellar hook-basal body complex protein [Bacillota bacterium]